VESCDTTAPYQSRWHVAVAEEGSGGFGASQARPHGPAFQEPVSPASSPTPRSRCSSPGPRMPCTGARTPWGWILRCWSRLHRRRDEEDGVAGRKLVTGKQCLITEPEGAENRL